MLILDKLISSEPLNWQRALVIFFATVIVIAVFWQRWLIYLHDEKITTLEKRVKKLKVRLSELEEDIDDARDEVENDDDEALDETRKTFNDFLKAIISKLS